MKQTIDLMRPRYKVIADYPESIHEVGDILSGASYEKHALYKDKYPHLFKKLEWWEERPESEMPEYLKGRKGGVSKVLFYHMGSASATLDYQGTMPMPLELLQPATEAEYQNYLKSKS